MTRRMSAATALLCLGCNGPAAPEPVPARQATVPAGRGLPAGVPYEVIKDEDESAPSSPKRMVDLRLSAKVSPEVLRTIAQHVKSQEARPYDRTFVFVYLPERVPGVREAPWVTCHFNPTLDVKILGLTREEEAAYRKVPVRHPGQRIGCWLREMQFSSIIEVIYEVDGAIKLGMIDRKGDRSDFDMTELPAQDGRRFQLEGSDEIYDIDESGVLRMINRDGKVFAAAPPLE